VWTFAFASSRLRRRRSNYIFQPHQRFLRAKRQDESEWGALAFAFVEKSAEAIWNSELTELENEGLEVTWEHFCETMISYFGTQLPAREAQVKYKACKQETTVADFVRRLKACVQILETTPLKPSMGDVISHFVENLATEPRAWVLQQAPATWYTLVREVYLKALQWETNNSHRVETITQGPTAKVFTHVQRSFQGKSHFKSLKRKPRFAGRHNAKRARVEGDGAAPEPRKRIINDVLYQKRVDAGQCFKCGLEGSGSSCHSRHASRSGT